MRTRRHRDHGTGVSGRCRLADVQIQLGGCAPRFDDTDANFDRFWDRIACRLGESAAHSFGTAEVDAEGGVWLSLWLEQDIRRVIRRHLRGETGAVGETVRELTALTEFRGRRTVHVLQWAWPCGNRMPSVHTVPSIPPDRHK
jgi:hypothetical protein